MHFPFRPLPHPKSTAVAWLQAALPIVNPNEYENRFVFDPFRCQISRTLLKVFGMPGGTLNDRQHIVDGEEASRFGVSILADSEASESIKESSNREKTAGHGRKDDYPRQGANNPESTKEIVGQDENLTTGGSVPVKIDAEELLSIWAASDESARSDLLPIARGWVASSWRRTHTFRRMQIFRSKSLVC